MKLPRSWIAPALALAAMGAGSSFAQESAKPKAKPAPVEDVAEAPKEGTPFKSLAELDAAYARKAAELERRRIADLSALAPKLSGPEADVAYHQIFQMAIARDRYEAAAEAAAAYLRPREAQGPRARTSQPPAPNCAGWPRSSTPSTRSTARSTPRPSRRSTASSRARAPTPRSSRTSSTPSARPSSSA